MTVKGNKAQLAEKIPKMITFDYPQTDRWLKLPIEMQDESKTRSARIVTTIIIALLTALLFWAALAPIDEAAIATGQIVPASPVSNVHHLEGGIVDSVFVKNGDHVYQGEALIRLRPEQTASDFSQLDSRLTALQLKSIRLGASLVESEPDFGALGERFPELRDEQRLAYRQNVAEAREERQQLQLAVERTGDQLRTAKEEANSLALQVDLQTRLTAVRQKSNQMGYTALPLLLQSQTSLEEVKQRLISANGRIAELTRMYDEASAKLRQAIAERLRKLTEERADTGAQLSETRAALEKYTDRMRRLEIRAPIEGVVHALDNSVSGEVVKPGALVVQIVPSTGGIVAEVEMEPRDVGHVLIGNDAEIRMSNYDPNVFGVITGYVQQISATTFETKDGRPFYRVRISLHRDHVASAGDTRPLMPGMTLQAQIKTGSKSLLRYLLKPIYQSLNTAFSER